MQRVCVSGQWRAFAGPRKTCSCGSSGSRISPPLRWSSSRHGGAGKRPCGGSVGGAAVGGRAGGREPPTGRSWQVTVTVYIPHGLPRHRAVALPTNCAAFAGRWQQSREGAHPQRPTRRRRSSWAYMCCRRDASLLHPQAHGAGTRNLASHYACSELPAVYLKQLQPEPLLREPERRSRLSLSVESRLAGRAGGGRARSRAYAEQAIGGCRDHAVLFNVDRRPVPEVQLRARARGSAIP